MKNKIAFNEVRTNLINDIDKEILSLKHFLEGVDEEKVINDPEICAEVAERIFYAAEGLKKISSVLEFIDGWEENGDPPQLSNSGYFVRQKEQSNLKDWQKEVMFSEGHIW